MGRVVKTVPAGKRLYFRTSQMTSLLGSRVNGSLNMRTGTRYMSLLEPSAWYVLEPSKFHSGMSEGFKQKMTIKTSISKLKCRKIEKVKYITDTLEVFQCIVLNSGKYLFSSWTRMQFHLCCVQRVTHPFHDGSLWRVIPLNSSLSNLFLANSFICRQTSSYFASTRSLNNPWIKFIKHWIYLKGQIKMF